MKTFGSFDLYDHGSPAQASREEANRFPEKANPGQTYYKDGKLYIFAALRDNVHAWFGLTTPQLSSIFFQNTAQAKWTVSHGLNSTDVSLQAYSADGRLLSPTETKSIDANSVRLSFPMAVSGHAVAFKNQSTHASATSCGFEHIQSELSDRWEICHQMNGRPLWRVFIGQEEIQPRAIEHPNMSTSILFFDEPKTGLAQAAQN